MKTLLESRIPWVDARSKWNNIKKSLLLFKETSSLTINFFRSPKICGKLIQCHSWWDFQVWFSVRSLGNVKLKLLIPVTALLCAQKGHICWEWYIRPLKTDEVKWVKVAQLCLTLCNPMDWDYTVHGILQARILKWVAFPYPGDLPNPWIKPRSPALQADSLPAEPRGKPRWSALLLTRSESFYSKVWWQTRLSSSFPFIRTLLSHCHNTGPYHLNLGHCNCHFHPQHRPLLKAWHVREFWSISLVGIPNQFPVTLMSKDKMNLLKMECVDWCYGHSLLALEIVMGAGGCVGYHN